MFKKLLFLVALVAVGAGSYGIARAYFSNIGTPATGTAEITAGTVSVSIANHDGSSMPFTITNMMPGDQKDVVFDVVNTSSVSVNLVGAINGSWGDALGDKMMHIVGAQYWDGSAWAGINSWDEHGNFKLEDATDGFVPANQRVAIKLTAGFDKEAGNDLQGGTYAAVLRVVAVQVGGALPTEF